MSREDELLAAMQPLKAFAEKYGYKCVTANYIADEESVTLFGYTFDEPHDKDLDVIFQEEAANGRQA